MADWYYANGDENVGPINDAMLKQLAQGGTITPETMVWKEGLADWVPARRLKGLFPAGAAAKPAVAKPSPVPPVSAQPPLPQDDFPEEQAPPSDFPGDFPPPYEQREVATAVTVVETSNTENADRKARAGLILSLIGIVISICGIIGLIFGALALAGKTRKKVAAWIAIIIPILQIILATTFFLLALPKLRAEAKKASSATNLAAIYTAITLYQGKFSDAMPPNLEMLVYEKTIEPSTLTSPVTGMEPMDAVPDANAYPPIKLTGKSDYIYMPGSPDMPQYTVIAYENPEDYKNKGTQILRMNGTVEWVDMATFNGLMDTRVNYELQNSEKRKAEKAKKAKQVSPDEIQQ